jgi:hypothetical protein
LCPVSLGEGSYKLLPRLWGEEKGKKKFLNNPYNREVPEKKMSADRLLTTPRAMGWLPLNSGPSMRPTLVKECHRSATRVKAINKIMMFIDT